jgi:quinol monooxygenase YgiN
MNASIEMEAPSRPTADGLFAITVAFSIKPEWRKDFLLLVRKNAAASLQAEAGCLRFDVLSPIAAGEPDVFLYEVYADRSAFDAHLASSHFQSFDAGTRDMVNEKTIAEFRIEVPLPG